MRFVMSHDAIFPQPLQAAQPLAVQLYARLVQFLRPVLSRLAQHLDIRLVQTALDLIHVILTHGHRTMGLLLSECHCSPYNGSPSLSVVSIPGAAYRSGKSKTANASFRLQSQKVTMNPSAGPLLRWVAWCAV